MISKRRVTADLFIQVVLLCVMLIAVYRAEVPADAKGFSSILLNIFSGGWWLAPMLLLMLWQYTYNHRLKKRFLYPFRIQLNKVILGVTVIWLAAKFFADNTGIVISNILLLLIILTGFAISCRDFANRYYWPKPFWQLR
jgi:hypothetical protein